MGEHLGQPAGDPRQVRGNVGERPALMGQRHVDQPAGIDDVVRGIENAAAFQLIGHLQAGQLVVGRTGHRRAAQLHHALPGQDRAQAARREDIAGRTHQCFGGHRLRVELLHRQLHPALVVIADQQLGTRRMQLFGQGIADIAQPLHRHPQALQVVAAQACHRRGANAGEHAHGRMRRGVAGAGGAGDMPSRLGDAVHVEGRGTAVGGGDVAAFEGIDETPERLEQRRAVFHMGIADDHRLAAAQWQAGQGRLVGHALGQADGVGHGAVVIRVGQVTTAAQCRAQALVMDGDHRLEPGERIDTQVQ